MTNLSYSAKTIINLKITIKLSVGKYRSSHQRLSKISNNYSYQQAKWSTSSKMAKIPNSQKFSPNILNSGFNSFIKKHKKWSERNSKPW